MRQTTILVADDDPSIAGLLRDTFDGEGWQTCSALNGEEALSSFHQIHPDLVILDVNMPGMDGIEVCRRIAAESPAPVIMLSGIDDSDCKVKCLGLGAVDYVTKAAPLEELIARCKVALRHHGSAHFVSGDLEIDFEAMSVKVRGVEIDLTLIEYRLLEELALNAGTALTYEQLLHKVWGPEFSGEKQYLHVHIGHLRAKLEQDAEDPSYIITVPGIGYRFQGVAVSQPMEPVSQQQPESKKRTVALRHLPTVLVLVFEVGASLIFFYLASYFDFINVFS